MAKNMIDPPKWAKPDKLTRDTIDQVRYAIEQGKIGQISTTREYEWLQNQYLNYQKSLEKEKPIPEKVQENPEKNKFLKRFI